MCTLYIFRELINKGYTFEERGEIEIKGKGKMLTYFLVSGPADEAPKNIINMGNSQTKAPSSDNKVQQDPLGGDEKVKTTNTNSNIEKDIPKTKHTELKTQETPLSNSRTCKIL